MTALQVVDLREDATQSGKLKVDRSAGLVHGIRVMGFRSMNRVQGKPTRYTREAMASAAQRGLYNCAVYVDHPSRENPNAERRYGDRIGQLENVSARADGLYGTLRVNKGHRLAEQLFADCEMGSRGCGLSHNAQGVGEVVGDEFVVSEIRAVRSVDVVAEAATSLSFAESRRPEPARMVRPMPFADLWTCLPVHLQESELMGECWLREATSEAAARDVVSRCLRALDTSSAPRAGPCIESYEDFLSFMAKPQNPLISIFENL